MPSASVLRLAGHLARPLATFISIANGHAFDEALHVFPPCPGDSPPTLREWNSESLWRDAYGDMSGGYLFFAEDYFGDQFAARLGSMFRSSAETGTAVFLAGDLEGWAECILRHPPADAGSALAEDWQRRSDRLKSGKRLLPKVPFVLGGQYDAGNPYAGDAVAGMRFRGYLARQIESLPDGMEITLRITV